MTAISDGSSQTPQSFATNRHDSSEQVQVSFHRDLGLSEDECTFDNEILTLVGKPAAHAVWSPDVIMEMSQLTLRSSTTSACCHGQSLVEQAGVEDCYQDRAEICRMLTYHPESHADSRSVKIIFSIKVHHNASRPRAECGWIEWSSLHYL